MNPFEQAAAVQTARLDTEERCRSRRGEDDLAVAVMLHDDVAHARGEQAVPIFMGCRPRHGIETSANRSEQTHVPWARRKTRPPHFGGRIVSEAA
jgi:hypothetical protein